MNNRNHSASERLDDIKDNVKNLVDRGRDRVDAFKDAAVDLKDRAGDRGGALLDSTTSLIKKHPIAAVGIAFGVGYLLMRIVRR